MRACRFRPPHDAVAEGGLEHFRIVAELNHQPAALRLAGQIVERGRQRQTLMALERDGDAVLVARQRHQHLAMAFGKLGKIMRL